MTFKKLVEEMAKGTSVYEIGCMIDASYQAGKINYQDHETLYNILRRMVRGEN